MRIYVLLRIPYVFLSIQAWTATSYEVQIAKWNQHLLHYIFSNSPNVVIQSCPMWPARRLNRVRRFFLVKCVSTRSWCISSSCTLAVVLCFPDHSEQKCCLHFLFSFFFTSFYNCRSWVIISVDILRLNVCESQARPSVLCRWSDAVFGAGS